MKKIYKVMSICLVVAMFAICGCLVGCSSKPVEQPEVKNPIIVEMVDIKEFFDIKKDINTNNVIGSTFELEVSGVPDAGVIKIAVDISGLNSTADLSGFNYILQQDANDPNSVVCFKDGYSYYTDENGQKVKVEGSVDNSMTDGIGQIFLIGCLWELLGEAIYGNLEYTGALIEKTTNTETREISYKVSTEFSAMGGEFGVELKYLDGQLQEVYLGLEAGMRLTRLEKLDYPHDLDQYVEIAVE